jgi:hypothetical protein
MLDSFQRPAAIIGDQNNASGHGFYLEKAKGLIFASC